MPIGSVDSIKVNESMIRRLYHRSVVKGEITLPAVPSMIDEYVSMCANLFADVGRTFSAEELAHVREVLQAKLAEVYSVPPVQASSYRSPLRSARP